MGPKLEGGVATNLAPESLGLDEHRCKRHRLTWRSRMPRTGGGRAEMGPATPAEQTPAPPKHKMPVAPMFAEIRRVRPTCWRPRFGLRNHSPPPEQASTNASWDVARLTSPGAVPPAGEPRTR